MSNSSGKVKFEDGKILWFTYQGSSGVCGPTLFEEKEANLFYGGLEIWTCECKGESVELAHSYGGGEYWQATACKKHKIIKSRWSLPEQDYDEQFESKKGLPGWFGSFLPNITDQ